MRLGGGLRRAVSIRGRVNRGRAAGTRALRRSEVATGDPRAIHRDLRRRRRPPERRARPPAPSLYRTATFSPAFAGDLVSCAKSVGAGLGATVSRAWQAEVDECAWFATSGPLYWDDTAPRERRAHAATGRALDH